MFHFRFRSVQVLAIAVLSIVATSFNSAEAQQGALTVESIFPTSNQLTASVATSIHINFLEPIDPASVTSGSCWAIGRWSGPAEGVLEVSGGGSTIQLTPDNPFSAGEQVMVILSEQITAVSGASIQQGGYSFLFWTKSAPASLQLNQTANWSTRTTPSQSTRSYGGLGSDLNNDGHLDISVINEDTADVRCYLNLGNDSGQFSPMVNPTSSVNLQASPNEPADFNRDGFVDIVVCNIAADTVSVLLGNGDGTFAPQQQINVGIAPRGVAVLDVDGDGDQDVVNTNYGTGNLSILLNNGTGVFGAPTYFEGGGSGERSLATGDMNGDGLLDLVIGMINSGEIVVNLNNGDGTFTESGSRPAAGGTWMLALGDLNGDGHLDVTSVNASQDNGTTNFGNGDGTITPAIPYPADNFPLSTDVGDLDGDGDLDWVISSYLGDWFIYLNDGDGNFTFFQEILAPIAASCAVMMDIDNDQDLDLTLIDELADVVIIYEQEGLPPPEFIRGDANWDGTIDIGDVVMQLGLLFGCTATCSCPDVLDSNDDGASDISDPIYLLMYLFSSGFEPPAPYPGCGADPTLDPLECLFQPPCI
ncbi:MAG: FG-GAP-like repeat-containing protein [Planctomycetota bacterium]|nr:FG-GAP-like repeat-containing protein [Planctomycetota bacterium]